VLGRPGEFWVGVCLRQGKPVHQYELTAVETEVVIPKKVPDTNGGSLRSRSTATEQPMFDFGPRMEFLCVKLGKIPLNEPPLVSDTLNSPWKPVSSCLHQSYKPTSWENGDIFGKGNRVMCQA
jgi:hypothetical protein